MTLVLRDSDTRPGTGHASSALPQQPRQLRLQLTHLFGWGMAACRQGWDTTTTLGILLYRGLPPPLWGHLLLPLMGVLSGSRTPPPRTTPAATPHPTTPPACLGVPLGGLLDIPAGHSRLPVGFCRHRAVNLWFSTIRATRHPSLTTTSPSTLRAACAFCHILCSRSVTAYRSWRGPPDISDGDYRGCCWRGRWPRAVLPPLLLTFTHHHHLPGAGLPAIHRPASLPSWHCDMDGAAAYAEKEPLPLRRRHSRANRNPIWRAVTILWI